MSLDTVEAENAALHELEESGTSSVRPPGISRGDALVNRFQFVAEYAAAFKAVSGRSCESLDRA
jgi:hypothetical protein